MKTKTKIRFKLKVTNKNIALRFKAAQKKDPEFTLEKMAEKFGIVDAKGDPQRAVAWRWIQTKSYPRQPNYTYKCTHCNKTQEDRVSVWLNDGSLK